MPGCHVLALDEKSRENHHENKPRDRREPDPPRLSAARALPREGSESLKAHRPIGRVHGWDGRRGTPKGVVPFRLPVPENPVG
jgi:hypothetical protein